MLLNNGDRTFANLVSYNPVLSRDYPLAVTAADFSGDGKTDLAVAFLFENSSGGNLSVFMGRGDGTFEDPVPFDTGTDEPTSLASADRWERPQRRRHRRPRRHQSGRRRRQPLGGLGPARPRRRHVRQRADLRGRDEPTVRHHPRPGRRREVQPRDV